MCKHKLSNSLLGPKLKELCLVLKLKALCLVLLQAKVVHQDHHQANRLGTLINESEYSGSPRDHQSITEQFLFCISSSIEK
jgi:hypothetical protein